MYALLIDLLLAPARLPCRSTYCRTKQSSPCPLLSHKNKFLLVQDTTEMVERYNGYLRTNDYVVFECATEAFSLSQLGCFNEWT